jgi:pyruvate dehydrogenase E2 component (dihydrolipoamide acetyltransferase)
MPDVIMPKMGDSMEVGKLLSWLKKSGEMVKTGEVIAEIETDKSNVEIEAEDDGVLLTNVLEGAEVPVGEVIATIGGGARPVTPAPTAPISTENIPAIPQRKPDPMPRPGTISTNPPQERLKASPLARKVAKSKNIDIAQIHGTGPNGRIIEADVAAFATEPVAVSPVKVTPTPSSVPSTPPVGAKVQDLSQMRRVIARRMVESKTTIPHFYLTIEVDMGEAVALREKLNTYEEGLAKISLNDFIVKAAAKALLKYPDVNSVFQNDRVITSPAANVGIAVALDDGLIVPVVKNANTLTLRQIAISSKELINKARAKKLQPSDYSGGSFTVSNLGGFDIDNFIAIIDPSQGAILAVSTIVKKPVVVDDEIAIRQRLNLTFSGDHRVMDGATGAKFVQELKRLLQNPLSLIE